jgi:ketosteroid isomerase-like protein
MEQIDAIANRLIAAIEAGDRDALGALYADDVVVWHNTDQVEMTKEQNLASLDALAAMTTSRRYADVRRHVIDGGFVQQHVLNLEWGSGSGVLPGCVVVQLRDGLIARIDEYLDGATIASFGS